MTKAQGLPISTIIIAALGLVVLIILFAITTGRLAIFGGAIARCEAECKGPYFGDTSLTGVECDQSISRELPGAILSKDQIGATQNNPRKCSKCCQPII